MKKIAICMIFMFVLGASGTGCSDPATQQNAVTPASAETQETPAGTSAAAPSQEPSEEIVTEPPMQTAWPEPTKVDYQGKYLDVARDKAPSLYPALKLGGTAYETTWGSFRLPEGWSVKDADGPAPLIADGEGNVVGSVFGMKCIPAEPYFALLSESATPIAWETPDWPIEARIVTFESPAPTATEGLRTTIIRMACVFTGVDEDGTYMATCFSFDKAYADGGKMVYNLSNTMIDEIARSYIEGLPSN